ncbi:MAG TPA: hypothetical protein VIG47_17415, partial [Gemmatimonadaceae bacterium]
MTTRDGSSRRGARLLRRIGEERHEHARRQFDEAIIAHKLGELAAQGDLDVLRVERLEGPVARLLK